MAMSMRSIEARDPGRLDQARHLAEVSGAVIGEGPIVDNEYRIVLLKDREELWDASSRHRGMHLTFRDIDRRTGSGNLSHKQPIARAIGTRAERVIDATAGLGHDAALLACMGWPVMALERDPFIATLLDLSLADAIRDEEFMADLGGRLEVERSEATDWFAQPMRTPGAHDVIYLDPMFTQRRRSSALPRKPAQVLKALVDTSDDGEPLLKFARSIAHRVVVKRPDDGPELGGRPDLVFAGRQVRYDVYLQVR